MDEVGVGVRPRRMDLIISQFDKKKESDILPQGVLVSGGAGDI